MTEQNQPYEKNSAKTRRSAWRKMLGILLKLVFPLLVVASGVGFLKYQMDTRPTAERRKPERQPRLVTAEVIQKGTGRVILQGMGKVAPSRQVALNPEVSGVITAIDPAVVPGGFIKSGQILYQIDARDYETIVKQRQSELAKAQLNLKLEAGNQTVARQEYELLESLIQEDEADLVLRKPQLESAQQALYAAQAAFEKAKLDVERCSIRAPFNATVSQRFADLGARVSPTSPLAELTGTDEYWIEVLIPMDQLSWVEIPTGSLSHGSEVHIYNYAAGRDEDYRIGHVIQLLDQIEEQGRMARLLVAVKDPLQMDRPETLAPLLIGSYVRAEIIGRQIDEVVELARGYVRDGNCVWVINEKSELEIRPVHIAFSGKETVFIKEGLSDGERVVTTRISSPVNGLPLRLEESAPANVTPEVEISISAREAGS